MPMYYRSARAAIIVYDITKQSSFDNCVMRWVEELAMRGPPNIFIAVVGTKSDLESERVVSKDVVKTCVESKRGDFKGMIFMDCSAKTGEGVQELFEEICRAIETMKGNDNGEEVD